MGRQGAWTAPLSLFLLRFRPPDFFQETDASRADVIRFKVCRIFQVIFLVILFRRIEWLGWENLGHDRLREFARQPRRAAAEEEDAGDDQGREI